MIVIADTSPLNYLVLIGEADILLRLYHRVVIPEAVLRELLHPETPTIVSEWIARRPTWLEVERISCSRRKFEGPHAGDRFGAIANAPLDLLQAPARPLLRPFARPETSQATPRSARRCTPRHPAA